jgi:hypothetical protein
LVALLQYKSLYVFIDGDNSCHQSIRELTCSFPGNKY